MHESDRTSVARACDGDSEAFRSLVERHSRYVFNVAYRLTGSAQDAEDIVQDTFLKAYRQLSRFEARADFRTWIHRITVNRSIDLIRSRKNRELGQDPEDLERGADAFRRYTDWVRACLAELRVDETGEPLCAALVEDHVELRGDRADRLPDLVITWSGAPPARRIRSERLGTISAELATGRGGNHRAEAFCAIVGPADARAAAAGLRHIADLAPLVTRLTARG